MRFIRKLFMLSAVVSAISGAATWYLRKVWQYRDPVRTPAMSGRTIIAPADGVVTYVKRIDSGDVVSSSGNGSTSELPDITGPSNNGWLIGISTTALDSHYTYAPIDATVTKIEHHGSDSNGVLLDIWEYFLITWLRRPVDPYGRPPLYENERNTLHLKGEGIQASVAQIADKAASELSLHAAQGSLVSTGDKLGFSERGSQTELSIYDPEIELKVDVGSQVYGGQTVVATY